ncbi:MAG: signal recognition particle protein [Fidelibacterota bacterium]
MLEELTDRFDVILKKIRGHGKITERNISETLRDIRITLLEADVNYKVVKDFIEGVKDRSIGIEVIKSVTPGQQFVKILYDELVHLLGRKNEDIRFSGTPPTLILIVGLQGSGKTSVAVKLAKNFKKRGRIPLLVAADTRRPAAVEQLLIMGKSANIPTFYENGFTPLELCKRAVSSALTSGYDTLLFDTAGRLHIDTPMMDELAEIKAVLKPHEILFVADSMTGQDAVKTASEFLKRLDFDGIVLTKLDGDARGGAALSIRAVTGRPIKFITAGEKLDSIERFHPERMAGRILGMGDVVSLVEKAREAIDVEEALKLEKKLRKEEFTFDDFLTQLGQIKKMGSLDQILPMIPGLKGSKLKGIQVDERSFVRIEAIINSMTGDERRNPRIINGSRRKRIAMGSGTSVNDVNKLLKQFYQMQKILKRMSRLSGRKGMSFSPFNISI